MNYVKKLNEQQKDVHITLTHVFTLGAAWGIYKMRRDIGRLPWGTFKAAKKLGVTVLVDVQGGKDLVPVTVWDAHKLTIFEVAKIISERVKRAKDGKDDRHNKSTQSANFIPSFIAQPCIYGLTSKTRKSPVSMQVLMYCHTSGRGFSPGIKPTKFAVYTY